MAHSMPTKVISIHSNVGMTLTVIGQTLDIRVPRLDLIAAGSGITPTYQILNEILKEQTSIVPSNGHVGIKIWLLFANQTERDILLRDEVEQLAASNADRFA
ncbi:unnamed protein product [Adineta ricciae]|uniref:Oxidoreductase FAD/NAD(P)-binding domain-containing protein n=1 Tax=Adineta ricciae TaxID=249248 RepID=A0A814N0M8_ADIRI|nr:unnamed protein product [Adineta ricciae]